MATLNCPQCDADISDTYQEADPSVGIMSGGWFCDPCNLSVGEHEVEREPLPDDVQISFTCEPAEPATAPLVSGRPGTPGFEEFKRIARSWGYD